MMVLFRYIDEDGIQDIGMFPMATPPRIGECVCPCDDEDYRTWPNNNSGYVVTDVAWFPGLDMSIVLFDGRPQLAVTPPRGRQARKRKKSSKAHRKVKP